MVTGGGVWLTRNALGSVTGFGTYQVTEVLTFAEAPGTEAPGQVDNVGPAAEFRGGLAVLRSTYSDGSKGVLTVNCDPPAGVPSHVAVTVFFTGSISMITTPLPVAEANRPRPQVIVKAPSLVSMPAVVEGWSSPLKVRETVSPLGPLNAPIPSVQEIGSPSPL